LSRDRAEAGFTLIEALVALALILAFAAVIGPLIFQARALVGNADRRIAAQVLLRSLMDAPFDRSKAAQMSEGETQGLRWRIVGEPVFLAALPPREGEGWAPVRVTVTVSWGPGQEVSAETLRLARAE
jgi:prepilin-type N-terminal cleavage/methylation domain-containing protein